MGRRFPVRHMKDLYFSWSQDYVVRLADAVLVRGKALLNQYERCAKQIELAHPIGSFSSEYAFQRRDTCQGNQIRILFVGHLAHHKRVLDIVRAVALASHNLSDQRSLHLTLVGGEHPAEEERIPIEEIYEQADQEGILRNVECIGRVDDVQALSSLYRKADIFVLASAYEGFPRVLYEALLHSLPVITTPVGGIPDELQNDEQALFVPIGNPGAIAGAIERILYAPFLRQKLIREGYRWAVSQKTETSWQQYARLLDL
jgi:glycosyltransferase involved in cell wall biosynthesis